MPSSASRTVTLDQCPRPVVTALVVVATKTELEQVLAHLAPLSGESAVIKCLADQSVYFLGRLGSYNAAVVRCEMGAVGRDGAILATSSAVQIWRPKFVIMPGIAFGKDPKKQALGEVIVATRVIPYEIQRVGVKATVPRGPQPEPSLTLINRLKHLDWEGPIWRSKNQRPPSFGPMLSGHSLVDHPDRKAELFATYGDALGGEMESFGIYSAAGRERVEWIVLKAICDWGDGKKHKLAQAHAARNAMSLLVALLSEPGLHDVPAQADTAAGGGHASARVLAFETALGRVREACSRYRTSIANFVAVMEAGGSGPNGTTIPSEKKPLVLARRAEVEASVEEMLNAYNDACARYLGDVLDRTLFQESLGREVRELVEREGRHSARLRAEGGVHFKALIEVASMLREKAGGGGVTGAPALTTSQAEGLRMVLRYTLTHNRLPREDDLGIRTESGLASLQAAQTRTGGDLVRLDGGWLRPTLYGVWLLALTGDAEASAEWERVKQVVEGLRQAWTERLDRPDGLLWRVQDFLARGLGPEDGGSRAISLLNTALGYLDAEGRDDATGWLVGFRIRHPVAPFPPAFT